MLRTASVAPYNSSKKLSGGNYQAMPFHDTVAAPDDRHGGGGGKVGPTTSPASTLKECESFRHQRKDTESTANLSTDSPASGDQKRVPGTPKQTSGLAAQLSTVPSVDQREGVVDSQMQAVDDATTNRGKLVPNASNLSIRDMFESTRSDGDQLAGDDGYFDQEATQLDTPRHGGMGTWGTDATPPTSLSGTPIKAQVSDALPTKSPPISGMLSNEASLSSHASSRGSRYGATVLYSAIASLEDPTSRSFTQQRRGNAAKKYEFPSTQFVIPPQAQKRAWKSSGTTKKPGASGLLGEALAAPQVKTNEGAKLTTSQSDEGTVKKESTTAENMEANQGTVRASNLRKAGSKESAARSVKISNDVPQTKKRTPKRAVEEFRPFSDAYTPRMGKKEIKYKPAEKRTPVQKMSSGLGTLSRPNFRDALRRVAMILRQHIVKIEKRFEAQLVTARRRGGDGLFMQSMKDAFCEDRFVTPTYKCTMVRVPMARAGMVGGLKKIRKKYEIPSEGEIYEFAHRLFKTVQLSSECSIVCLIYVERLMEKAKVPLLASTWRPIVLCGLLLASKVWQDLSSWNIEFATVYPQYSLEAIHRLELQFLRMVRWDLYISSSLYAKYYFALRALVSKQDFRQRYNRMVGGVDSVQAAEARKIEERSTQVKEEALLLLSRSM